MLVQELIRLKRDGHILLPELLAEYVQGVTSGQTTDAQIAAFCMAVMWQGLNPVETAHLTQNMAKSGQVLQWDKLNGPVTDKHSTGGVGDKISLMLAPIMAACGAYVPMIAGRGLGHTGGTIDKLESIKGYNTQISLKNFQTIVGQIGCAIMGQTAELAPADRRIYAVRDVTATVEHTALITASILSKKLAAGLQSLVMDVKWGNGAFFSHYPDAEKLANSLSHTAHAAGLPLQAVLTDMNSVLGHSAGNAVEVLEAVDYLTGTYREPRLHDITCQLARAMLRLSGLAHSDDIAQDMINQALNSGKACEIFGQMVAAQGGPKDFVARASHYLPKAAQIVELRAPHAGTLVGMDTRAIGVQLIEWGAGRQKVGDSINHAVGLDRLVGVGTKLAKSDVICRLHLSADTDADAAKVILLQKLSLK